MTASLPVLLLTLLLPPQGDATGPAGGEEDPAADAARTAAPGEDAAPAQEEDDDSGWTAAVDVGLTIIEGNSESSTGSANATLGYEDAWNRYDFGAHYSGVRQTDRATGNATTTSRLYLYTGEYNRFLNERKTFYGYGKASSREDEPNGLVQRIDAGAGAGYQYKPWEKATLNVEAGASWVQEDKVGVAEEEESAVGRFAYDFKTPIKVSDGLKFLAAGEYLNGGEIETYVQDLGLNWKPADARWYLQLSLNVAWDGNPAPTFESTDRRYVLLLGVNF